LPSFLIEKHYIRKIQTDLFRIWRSIKLIKFRSKPLSKSEARETENSDSEENKFLPGVLRILDVYPGSRILIFTHPGSQISDSKTATKERAEKFFFVISTVFFL
jgi:hypothetical protein